MVVTDQVDAIRAFGIDPNPQLMTPRVLATVLTLPLLVALGDCAGLLGGFIVANLILHLWCGAIHVSRDQCAGFRRPVYWIHEANCFRIHHRHSGLL